MRKQGSSKKRWVGASFQVGAKRSKGSRAWEAEVRICCRCRNTYSSDCIPPLILLSPPKPQNIAESLLVTETCLQMRVEKKAEASQTLSRFEGMRRSQHGDFVLESDILVASSPGHQGS